MKTVLIAAAAAAFATAAVAQPAVPLDDQQKLELAYRICVTEYADTSPRMAMVPPIKAWKPGHSDCAIVQDRYIASQNDAAAAAKKKLIEDVAKK